MINNSDITTNITEEDSKGLALENNSNKDLINIARLYLNTDEELTNDDLKSVAEDLGLRDKQDIKNLIADISKQDSVEDKINFLNDQANLRASYKGNASGINAYDIEENTSDISTVKSDLSEQKTNKPDIPKLINNPAIDTIKNKQNDNIVIKGYVKDTAAARSYNIETRGQMEMLAKASGIKEEDVQKRVDNILVSFAQGKAVNKQAENDLKQIKDFASTKEGADILYKYQTEVEPNLNAVIDNPEYIAANNKKDIKPVATLENTNKEKPRTSQFAKFVDNMGLNERFNSSNNSNNQTSIASVQPKGVENNMNNILEKENKFYIVIDDRVIDAIASKVKGG